MGDPGRSALDGAPSRRVEESRVLLERTFMSIEEAVFIVRDRVILDCNRAACAMFGYDAAELVGMDSRRLHVDDEQWRLFGERGEPALRAGGVCHLQFRMRRRDGTVFPTEHTVTLLDRSAGLAAGVVSVVRDRTERAEAEAAQRRYRRSLEVAREAERRRISREIHDDLGQALTGLRLDLTRLRREVQPREGLEERIEGMDVLLVDALARLRRIATELRPGVLDQLGLVPALEWLCADFRRGHGVPCSLFDGAGPLSLGEERETQVFRVVQEALANVARHADASRVEVTLQRREGSLLVEVLDDGVGIAPTAPFEPGRLGLVGMRERAALLGGVLSVDRRVDGGTVLRLRIPLEAEP